MKNTFAIALILFSSLAAFAQTSTDTGPVLIPVNPGTVNGANGTVWKTTLWALNTDASASITVNCGQTPCPTVPSGITQSMAAPSFATHPGYFLQAQAVAADGSLRQLNPNTFWLELRSVDSVTAPQSAGIQIPVVHMDEFIAGPLFISHILQNGHSRLKLRIYALHDGEVSTLVQDLESDPADPDILRSGQFNNSGFIRMTGAVEGSLPAYAELDLPSVPRNGVTALRVFVVPDAPADNPVWAFVTITDNDSQQVTIATSAAALQLTPFGRLR